MTRKDYILLATALKQADEAGCSVIGAAGVIASRLEADNPRFDRQHFLAVVRGDKAPNSKPSKVR